MILIAGSLVLGILMGAAVKLPRLFEDRLSFMLNAILFIMLAALGAQVGANRDLLQELPKIGWRALLLAILTIIGSVAALHAVAPLFRQKDCEGD